MTVLSPWSLVLGQNPLSPPGGAGGATPTKDQGLRTKDRLEEVARSFESIFTQMLMQSMRATVKKSPLFDGGRGEEIFTGLLDTSIADASSKGGRGLGFAQMIVKQYARNVRTPEESKGARLDLRPVTS